MDAKIDGKCICCGKEGLIVRVYPISNFAIGKLPGGLEGTKGEPKEYCDVCFLKHKWK